MATLLTALIIFIVAYITRAGNDCKEAKMAIHQVQDDVEKKLDKSEFEYYKINVAQSIYDIKEMLREIRQEVKEITR